MKFRITIEKYYAPAAEYWTNVYWTNEADMAAAVTCANALVNAEKALYFNTITITKARIDDGLPDTDVTQAVVYNVAGTRTAPGSDLLPLFVVARVDFTASDGGRPSRKYIRGFLEEANSTFTGILSPILTLLANYGLAVVGTNACDPQGFDLTGAAPWPAPAMRQLRRGSKKKVIPSSGGTPV